MWNLHQELSLDQILLLFNVYPPPQGMTLLLIITFLINIPPMLFTNSILYDILDLIQVRISLFRHLVLRHICIYICNITQKSVSLSLLDRKSVVYDSAHEVIG